MKPTYDMVIVSCCTGTVASIAAAFAALTEAWAVWWVCLTLATMLMGWPIVYDYKWGLSL